mmetsp:Transcript_28634/g.61679  ORF Transcript_28634/g.61679 Transcript_28634/m.61679 type:complete len:372 (+) Transcript_28634:118-1233(+)
MVQQQQDQQQQTIAEEEHGNNIVARSEYEAALAAIESSFDNFDFRLSLSQQHQHDDNNVDGDDNNPDRALHVLDQEMITEIYQAAKASLLNNIKRVSRPINDDDYSNYVDQYHVVLDDDDDSDNDDNYKAFNDDDIGKNDCSEENHKDDGEEQEIDEEELVDKKAWKDAQALRTRIRTMAAMVQSVRERVLQHTEQGISSSVSKNLVDAPIQIVFDGEEECDARNHDNNDSNKEKHGDASNDKENLTRNDRASRGIPDLRNNADSSSSLEDSLKDLTKLLGNPQWTRLPNRIQSLQETIETIQKETAEDRILSQTEIAITSRYKDTIDKSARQKVFGENYEKGNSSSSMNDDSTAAMNPMDRLALFGQLFS